MEVQNKIFHFNPNQRAAIQRLFNYNDINKLRQDVDLFEDWIRKQNHFVVKEFGREYLERYLIANKGSVERAKKRFDKLCSLRNLLPELTKNIDIANDFQPLFRCSRQCILPKPTHDHYRVIISTVHNGDDIENVEFVQFYRYAVVFLEYMLLHDYNAGIEFIMDNRRMPLALAAKLNPIVVHKAFTLMEAYGLRLKRLHVISNSKLVDTMITVMKQGMSTKLGKRIEVHSTIESLHRFIPREMLPEDYGGKEKSVKELSENLFEVLSSDDHVARMKYIEGATTDESKRLTSSYPEEYFGLPGSFKTLCVD